MIERSMYSQFIKDLAQKTSASSYITEAVTNGYKYIMENEISPNVTLTLDSEFVGAYIDAIIFTGIDVDNPSGEGSSDFTINDFSDEAKETIVNDCNNFVAENMALLNAANEKYGYSEMDAGHDFWLTRNGHGAGFWDRGIEDIGDELTNASKKYPEQYAYLGDDGKVYIQ